MKNRNSEFLRRWPKAPKVVFFASPNSFSTELIQRFSVDMGVPVFSMDQIMSNVQQFAGRSEEWNHPFFLRVRDMLNAGDHDQLVKDKVALKLLRLTNTSREGFILTDFPRVVQEAEMLEEYRGGMNSFVHLSLPDDVMVAVEENKLACNHCGRNYYPESIVSQDQGIHIESFAPEDGHCFDCGSRDISYAGNPTEFPEALKQYKTQRDNLLGFYDHLGLLVDFELKHGYEDYERLKDQIQFNIKH